ncbi:unnamed protein product [Camellia sinensis]
MVSTLAMDFIATNSLPILPLNQKCRLRIRLDGKMFLSFGGAVPYRPVEDIAFDVAQFFQRGGTFQNYYMYHGGTNFGRTTGGPFIATSYDYDAPIDEYAAGVYKTGSGLCTAFLANVDSQSDAIVNFNGNSYNLPAWSVSILPDCKNVVLNTAKCWSWFNEPVGISSNNAFMQLGLVEQINTTAYKSDYLMYSLSTNSQGGSQTVLHVESLGHVLHAFINGKLAGSGEGNRGNAKVAIEVPITLIPGKNRIDLLSLTVGLQNYGAFFDKWGARVIGPTRLKGEELGLSGGGSSVWVSKPTLPKNQPLIWYKCCWLFCWLLLFALMPGVIAAGAWCYGWCLLSTVCPQFAVVCCLRGYGVCFDHFLIKLSL